MRKTQNDLNHDTLGQCVTNAFGAMTLPMSRTADISRTSCSWYYVISIPIYWPQTVQDKLLIDLEPQ